METALSEITLVLFTTIAPAGIVGYMTVALYGLLASREQAARASRYLVIPLVLVISGLIASATHLGTPANALYVLAGVGRSPLSNEVVAVVGFLAVGGVWWMLSFRDDVARAVQQVAFCLAIVAGLAALAMISLAYSVETVPTWNLPYGPLTLWLGSVAPGVLVGLFTLMAAGVPAKRPFAWGLAALAAVASVAQGVALGLEWSALAGIQTTTHSAQGLVPWLPAAAVAYPVVALLCVAVALLAVERRSGEAVREGAAEGVDVPAAWTGGSKATVAGAALVLLAAAFAVRFCFYASYMTAGV
ncbi:MAG: dimethyl sulfoxide reductase anchor subunit [Eggerthellaceae bacterium]|nr:dimethyl sulfoxide reductase anchor subunit [Eggerthellaceae bacterium]